MRTPLRAIAVLAWLAVCAAPAAAQPGADRVLGREDIRLLGAGLRVTPAQQTVPKDIATIVSTFLQAPNLPASTLPPFAPDAVVKGTLRGPGFAKPVEISARPNTPFNLPPFSTAGTYTLDSIRLESGGTVLLYGTPESVTIEVIEKLLVTQVTARPLTAAEIREKGIVFDKSSFQAYNFTASFAVGAANPVPLSFPVVLPRLEGPADVSLATAGLQALDAPKLPRLETIIPDTLKIQTQIPNLSVVGFTLSVPELKGKNLSVPPIPGVVVIPGDIGFLNQFFNVTLLVGNVAPAGSNLAVSELRAEIVLPPGRDNVPNSGDDPLRMAQTVRGESPRVQLVVQAGGDGKLGTADDVGTLAPGETGSAEYLVEGRREGTHVIEMQMTGTLTGLPVGPVTVTGRAAGTVLVRNPVFTLTFTHPDLINAGEPYTLDVTVTNTSESPANFVSVNLFPANISGATLVGSPTREVESIPPGDSTTVSFDLVAQITGPIVAATIDADDNVNGRFALKTSVGELGIPLSPDSLVLPKEARSLPADLRAAALGLLGKAWAVATAPAAALPQGVTRFSKQVVYDRAIELAEAGFRYSLGEPLDESVAHLALDYTGSGFTRLAERATSPTDLGFREADARGFDELRRRSVRGDRLAAVVGQILGAQVAATGPAAFHARLADITTWRPPYVSVLVTGEGGPSPYVPVVVDAFGRRMGETDESGKVVKEIPFADTIPLVGPGPAGLGQLVLLSSPEPGEFLVRLAPQPGDGVASGYSVSVTVPDTDGALRHVVFSGLTGAQVPAPVESADGAFRLRFAIDGASPATAAPTSTTRVADSAPRVVAVVQQPQADVVGCPVPSTPAGRVVAVLFSEEVTKASVQDGRTRGLITAFAPEANEPVGVALQPGRRIAFVAMRDPLGPFVPRSMTIAGATDARGNEMSPVTLPMTATIEEEGALVSGRVLNPDGTPAPGVEARLFSNVGCLVGISAKPTDEEGRFAWDFVLKDADYDRLVAVDPRTGDSRGVNFQVQRNGQRLEVNVVFLGRGTIAGRTLDEDGTPLAKTSIRVTSLTDRSQYGATSGPDGTFTITGVPVGNLIVEAVNTVVRAEVTVSEYLPNSGATVTRDLRLLRDDRRPATVTFGSASGVVLRGDGVTPVPNVPVVAYYKNGSQNGIACPPPPDGDGPAVVGECALAVATTDATGAFRFDRLASGQFRLETFDQVSYQQGEARLIVPADGAATANVLLGLGLGTVRGVVLDPSGQRVSGARVGGGLSLSTTGADGTFVLTDVPIGRREIVAVSDALGTRGTTIVDLIRAGDEANATIVLDPVGGIAGTVTRADGLTPASRAKVFLFYPIDGGIRVVGSTEADAQGRFAFTRVALRSDYRVSSFLPGFTEGNITEAVLRFANQVARADIRYRGQGGVRGVVLGAPENGADGTPLAAAVGVSGEQLQIAGGLVGVAFKRVENFAVAETDISTGRFQFGGVWVGGFTLRAVGAFSPEPAAFEGRVERPGQVVDMRLQLQPTSTVTGRVLLPDGVTPAGQGVQVTLRAEAAAVVCSVTDGEEVCDVVPQGGVQRFDAVTDADGRYEMANVGARRFTLTARDAASGREGAVKADVRAGETAEIDVRLWAQPTLRVQVFRSDAVTRVPGALVEITQEARREDDGSYFSRRPLADPSGEVVLVGVNAPSEGEFTVRATDRDGGGFSGRATGRIRAEDDGKTVTLKVYLLDQQGVVEGAVFRADGTTPVPNAEVAVSNEGGALAYAVTDGSGRYRVETIPLGPVYVDVFEAATGRRGFAQGSIDFSGREITLNVRQYGLGLVTGQLVQTGELAPLKGWALTLSTRLPSGRAVGQLLTTSDVDGRFFFPGVTAGEFTVRASRRDVTASGHADGVVERDGQRIDLPIVVDIPRPQFGRIEGTVFAPTGGPSAFAQVQLGGEGVAKGTTTTADGQGRYAFENVRIGRYALVATPQVGAAQRATAYAELLFENDAARADLVLGGIATITGRVLRGDGVTPAAFANVFLNGQPFAGCESDQPIQCSPNPDGSPNTKCLARASRGGCLSAADAEGRFAFNGISARTFSVLAEAVSGEVGQVGGPIDVGQTLDLRIVLSPSTSVSGRVVTKDGQPVASAVVEMAVPPAAPQQPDRVYVATDAAGTFVFEAVRLGGPYPLTVTDPFTDGIAARQVLVESSAAVDLGDLALDSDAPAVVTTDPAPLSTGVPLAAAFRVVFSEPVSPATVNAASIVLSSPTAPLTLVITMEPGDASALVRPLGGLAENTRYTLLVNGVKDRFGKSMRGAFVTTFTSADLTPPTIAQLTPAAGGSGVPVTSAIRVQYNEAIAPQAFTGAPIALSRDGQALAGRTDFAFGNTVVVFTPAFPLADGTRYDLAIAAARDLAGNASAPLQTSFSTTDRTPPQITALRPAGDGRVIEGTVVDVAADTGSEFDVALVDFYVNGVLTFTDRAAPFVFPLLATPALGAPGARIALTALATDTSGNRGTTPATASVEIVADTPPVVTITGPADGFAARNGERVTLSFTARDDVGVGLVGYRAETGRPQDAASVALDPVLRERAQAFGFNMPADAAPGTVVRVSASARDTKGQLTTATVGLVVLDAVAPTVTINGAASGARLAPGDRAQIIVAASDPGGVRQVTFRATGAAGADEVRAIEPALGDAALAFTLNIPATATAGQTISLDATATDAAGNVGTAARLALTVADRVPPTLSLRTSTGRLEAVPGAPVTIVAEAEDQVGVARIALSGSGAFTFTDARSFSPALGFVTTEFVVNVPANAAPGTVVAITGRATDLVGNTSDPVTLSLEVKSVADITAPSTIVIAGETATVPLTLSAPAPAGGLSLTLQSRAPGVAAPQPGVTIPAGQAAGTASVTGVSTGIAQVDVLAQGVVRGSFSVSVRGGVVRGVVRDLNGPAAGASVSVEVGGDIRSTTTGADGAYFVEGFSTNSTGVQVRAQDAGGRFLGFAQGQLSVARGFAVLDLLLVEAGSISGQVKRATGEAAPAGVRVDLFALASPSEPQFFTFTNDEGRFEFPVVALGSYRLDAALATTGDRGRTSVSVTEAGKDVPATITFLGRGAVTGTVRSGTAVAPNARVRINASSIFGPAPEVLVNAGPDGVYRVEGVLAGRVRVSTYDSVTERYASASGNLDTNGQVLTLDLTLRDYASLEGRVLRADGVTPVPGARLLVSGAGSEVAFTDAEGRYRFAFLPLGSYVLNAADLATAQGTTIYGEPVGAVTGRATATLSQALANVTQDVALLPVGSIVVLVQDGNGNLVRGGEVRIDATNSSQGATQQQRRTATTSAQGLAVVGSVIAGTYEASATAAGFRSNEVTRSLAGGQVDEITLTLEPTGSVAGLLVGPDGATPAEGWVTLDEGYLGFTAQRAQADGSWRFDNVRFGTHTVYGFDLTGRMRAAARDIAIDLPNEVEQRTLSLVGLGSVSGRVVGPDGAGVPFIPVDLQAFGAFGGAQQRFTNEAGFYAVPDVVAGDFRASVLDVARQLAAEGTGTIPPLGGSVSIDLALVANSVQLPVTLYNANGQDVGISAGGQQADFGSNRVRMALDVVRDGSTTRFAGGQFGTREDAGREIATRQTIGDLLITRKVFVPVGYLTRYLEQFTNAGTQPVTFDARIVSTTDRTSNGPRVSSSGDAVFDVTGDTPDRWVFTTTSNSNANPPSGSNGVNFLWVFDGEGAAARASTLGIVDGSSSVGSTLTYGWTLTLQPGETATLLHFHHVTHSQAAGVATAGRLVQLPPEALSGLSATEIATTRNFAVPAGGVSALEPLPPLNGAVSGRVFEHDRVTLTPATGTSGGAVTNNVRLRSTIAPYSRWQLASLAAQTSAFSFASRLNGTTNNLAIPLAPFELVVQHPWTPAVSPATAGTFAPGAATATQDVVFSNTSIVSGTVRRHTGVAVTGLNGTVGTTRTSPTSFTVGAVPIATSTGEYRVLGVPEGTYTFSASVALSTGGTLSGTRAATIVPGGATALDITLAATGGVTGTLRAFDGTLQANRQVSIGTIAGSGSFSTLRTTTTNAQGVFAFVDVPAGAYTLRAVDPANNFATTTTVTVVADQTATADLTYLGAGTVTGVLRSRFGEPVVGASVTLFRGTVQAQVSPRTTTTGAGGVFTFTNVFPETWGLTSVDTTTSRRVTETGIVVGAGQTVTRNLQYLAVGFVTVTVQRPAAGGGFAPAPGVQVTITLGGALQQNGTTNASGTFQSAALLPNTYRVNALDPVSRGQAQADVVLPANGSTSAVLTLPATGALDITVVTNLPDGSTQPLADAEIALAESASAAYRFRGYTDAQGRLLTQNVLAGTQSIRVIHPEHGGYVVYASTTVPAFETVPVTIGLVPAGTLQITVLDGNGAPLPGVDVRAESRTPGASEVEYDTTDSQGRASVPAFGAYQVTASHPTVYGLEMFRTGQVATPGAQTALVVRFPPIATLTGRVTLPGGGAADEADLTVSAGIFEGYATTDAAGAYALEVPAGVPLWIEVTCNDGSCAPGATTELVGAAQVTVPAGAGAATRDIVVDDLPMPVSLTDGNGWTYSVERYAQLAESRFDNSRDRYRFRGGFYRDSITPQAAVASLDGQQITVGGQVYGDGLFLERRIFVPRDGYFVRFLDLLRNDTDAAVTADVTIDALPLEAWSQTEFTTSDGDGIVTNADRWLVGNGASSRRVSHVFAGEGAAVPAAVTYASGMLSQTWRVTLQPGQRVALLHFGGEHRNGTAGQSAAQRLVQLPPEALAGLGAEDRAPVANFAVPTQSAVTPFATVSGRVTRGGSGVAGAQVTVTAANPFLNAPGTTTTDASGSYTLTYPIVGAYSVVARDPGSGTQSSPVTGSLAPGQTSVTANPVLP